MEDFVRFISQEWLLACILVALVATLIMHTARQGAQGLSPNQLTQKVNREEAVVLDVRDSKEFNEGHIVDAMNVPHAKIAKQLTMLEKHKQKPVIVVCKFGQHAGAASKVLQTAGFEKVFKLTGGMTEWQSSSMPVVKV